MIAEKSARLRVLVVDDEPLIRWSAAETLTDAGYVVIEASDAKETFQQLTDGPAPDVILLDCRLPDSSDLKHLEAVRRLAPSCPVILMTASDTPALVAGAVALGAYRVVTKPLEMNDLAELVQEAYQSRRL
jgi:DNA-binding NtrC family response regulator